MKMGQNGQTSTNLTETEISDHIIHLYTSKVDKFMIQRAFLASMRDDERAIIVSSEEPETIRREFDSVEAEIKILKPEDIRSIGTEVCEDCKPRLVIDAGSYPRRNRIEIEEMERYIDEVVKKHSLNCLCTYMVNELSPGIVKQLTTFHNQLKLTTSDLTLISGDFIDRSTVSDDSIRKMVKDNLEAIILALLQSKAMCGSDVIGTIHLEFKVLLSPGTVYPLLHSLQKKGLLTSVKEGKEKRYFPSEDSELEIRRLVFDNIQARKLLNSYLQKELALDDEELIVEPLQHVSKKKPC